MDKQDFKRLVVRVMRGAFSLVPLAVVRAVIRRVPRLAVGAPPNIEVHTSNFLGEFALRLSTSSCVERSMIRGTYEPDNLQVIRTNVRPGDRCIDVGANVGAMTFAMAQAARPGGRVYAFEPGPPFFARLKHNVSLNPAVAETIVCVNAGLSDADGTLRWAEDDSDLGRGNGGLVERGGIEVPVVTLDGYAAAHVDGRVAFIKVDVEGWELHVLRGAQRVLREHRPIVLFETLREFDERPADEFFAGLSALFDACGYDLFAVHAGGRLASLRQLGETQMTLARPR